MVYILEDAQEAVKEISQDFHKDTVYTSAFFHSLILEQLGQATHSYMREVGTPRISKRISRT